MIIVVALSLLLNDKNLPIQKIHGIFFREERKISLSRYLTTLHVLNRVLLSLHQLKLHILLLLFSKFV